MITQQVASYLIKKMTSVVQTPSRSSADPTDDLFKQYLSERNSRTSQDVIYGGLPDNKAIVDAFKWRAADLVFWFYISSPVQC